MLSSRPWGKVHSMHQTWCMSCVLQFLTVVLKDSSHSDGQDHAFCIFTSLTPVLSFLAHFIWGLEQIFPSTSAIFYTGDRRTTLRHFSLLQPSTLYFYTPPLSTPPFLQPHSPQDCQRFVRASSTIRKYYISADLPDCQRGHHSMGKNRKGETALSLILVSCLYHLSK